MMRIATHHIILYLWIVYFKHRTVATTQHLNGNDSILQSRNCQSATHSLVERFFNYIFSEFKDSPPACICVQMCANQPTYCYPNGCLKLSLLRKRSNYEEPTTKYVEMTSYTLSESVGPFVDVSVNPEDIRLEDLDEKNQSYLKPDETIDDKEINKKNSIIINPFKNKIISNNKRKSKLNFNYNIQSQVRNMISNKLNRGDIDISKTRWPHVLRSYQKHKKTNDLEKINDIDSQEINFQADNIDDNSDYFKSNTIRINLLDDVNKYINVFNESNTYSISKLIEDILKNNVSVENNEWTNDTVSPNNSTDENIIYTKAGVQLINLKPNVTKNATTETIKYTTLMTSLDSSDDDTILGTESYNNVHLLSSHLYSTQEKKPTRTGTYYDFIGSISKYRDKINIDDEVTTLDLADNSPLITDATDILKTTVMDKVIADNETQLKEKGVIEENTTMQSVISAATEVLESNIKQQKKALYKKRILKTGKPNEKVQIALNPT